ncbi:MAG TPA: phosphate signaling complex protein PhoU [Desulfobacteria bacterium]|nr:phosphate signaling complex protein PhoU [Desulfobacteria bacterium]
MTTRGQFDKGLEELRNEIIALAHMVESQITGAISALKDQDMDMANELIVNDLKVNDLQAEIEERCMLLIATQQPFARDLRKIVAGFKISINLERMGDLAVDIAKMALRIGKEPLIKPLIDIPRMCETVKAMVEGGVNSYLNEDESLARQMSKLDDTIDHLYNQIYRELLVFMIEDPKTITQATYLIFTARFLERMGDYCTNIAEEIVYIVSGRRSELNS